VQSDKKKSSHVLSILLVTIRYWFRSDKC